MMSETVPTPAVQPEQSDTRPVEDEFAKEQARLEAEYNAKKAKLEQQNAFGQFDTYEGPLLEDGRPIAGSHADYHAQRPSDGVVREGDRFRHAATGQFSNEAAYEGQKETDDEYYDRVNGVEAQGPTEAPAYDMMSIPQLALETAKADAIGDRAVKEEAMKAIAHNLMQAATEPGSDWTDEQYNKQLQDEYDRFLHLVDLASDKILNKNEASTTPEVATNDTPESTGDTPEASEDDEFASNEEVYGPKTKAQAEAEGWSEDGEQAESNAEKGKPDSILYNGAEVFSQSEPFEAPSGRTYREVMFENGSILAVPEDDLEFVYGEQNVDDPEATESQAENATANAKMIDADGNVIEVTAGEPYENEDGLEVVDVEFHDGSKGTFLKSDLLPLDYEKPKSTKEKITGLFKKGAKGLKNFFSPSHIGALYTTGMLRLKQATIDRGIDEDTSPEDAEKKRRRNRVILIAGGVAVATAAVAFGLHEIAEHANDAHTGSGGNGSIDTLNHNSDTLNNATEHAKQEAAKKAQEAANAAQRAAESAPVDVSPGEGGIRLFQDLGINNPTETWTANQDSLLNNFPNDFYRMADGNVGIARPGALSEAAAKAIDALK